MAQAGSLSFDHQARDFDRRAGLPEAAATAVAAAVAGLGSQAPDDGCWLEVGVGTGELGLPLARAVAPFAPFYGFDLSLGMIRAAAAKGPPSSAALLVADADARWPLADGAARGIFCSRAAHLLDKRRFLAETRRVLAPGGVLVLGAVRRDPGSVRATLQREMRRLLGGAGRSRRDSRQAHEALCAELAAAGGERLETVEAARWPVAERPADSLEAWRAKGGVAGQVLPADEMEALLKRLEDRALELYGDLYRLAEAEETYGLQAVRLAGGPRFSKELS
jgi:ubiquinone/menaquinone biosynthesis C-methylase UbiE